MTSLSAGNWIVPLRTSSRLLPLISPLRIHKDIRAQSQRQTLSCNQNRQVTTSRRTVKARRLKPDSSLTASIPEANLNDHILFNPPSSAPSSFHTPPAFLPQSDPRRKLLSQSHNAYNPYIDASIRLPPTFRNPQEQKQYHLGPEEIAEIRKLRTDDPYTWTRNKLAKKFNCSNIFIGMVVDAPAQKILAEKRKLAKEREDWGRRKRYAREDRGKRKDLWSMDI